jgi:hypothetical protein
MFNAVLYWSSGYESWCVILSQWLRITVLYWASGYESWCVILSQWLRITVCYTGEVVMIHGVLCWASDHWRSITHSDSQPLVQYNTPWFTTTGSAWHAMIHNHWLRICVLYWASGWESPCIILGKWLWIMLCYIGPVDMNDVLCWASW